MGRGKDSVQGITLVVDESMVLLGVINKGDILRFIADGIDLEKQASEVMIQNPVTAPIFSSDNEILRAVRSQLMQRTDGEKDITRYVPLIDENRVVCDLVDMFSLLARSPRQGQNVEIHGLGFVGLTLAVFLAGRGHFVTGIDSNARLVKQLSQGEPHVFEPRLPEMMRHALENKELKFLTALPSAHNRVVIIAVGTPVMDDGSACLKALKNVCETVGARLQPGDLVMLRSTVPVGTTKGFVRDLLENASGFKAGEEFYLAFTPERTVEGHAMQELSSLPQIVGGFSSQCVEMACGFWQSVSDTTVRVDSLEAAELVKLSNNSYRDLSFAFANGLALLADQFNLDAAKVINAANEGYPRNPIPRPSPGVGGYCLTKDPFLYAAVDSNNGHAVLSRSGRAVNSQAGHYPLKIVARYAKRLGRPLSDLSVLLVGLAFKGWPETNDLRGSTALDIGLELMDKGCKVFGYDAVVKDTLIKKTGITPVQILDAVDECDVLLILNNHPGNLPEGLLERLQGCQTLLFDGWSQLNRQDVERYNNITYSTMGYMTPEINETSFE